MSLANRPVVAFAALLALILLARPVPAGDEPSDALERPVTVTFVDHDAARVVGSIAALTRASVFYPGTLRGKVSCAFTDMPWREALQRVADQVGYEVVDADHGAVRLAKRR